MEALGGQPSERTGSEAKSTLQVAGPLFGASLSAALLAFITITLFMNDEFLNIVFLPNLLDVLNFPFFGGVLLILTVYKFQNRLETLLKCGQILNFIMCSIFGLMLLYFGGVYMEPWMSVIGQFYHMFPAFLAIILMTQTWTFGIHYFALSAHLTSLNPNKNKRRIYGAFSGLTLLIINVYFWTFTHTNLLGLSITILAAGVVGMSIWILKVPGPTNQDLKLQNKAHLAPHFIKILLVITLVYIVGYYLLSQFNQYLKVLLGIPPYLSIVFITHKSPENTTQREVHPPRLRDEIKIHLQQKSRYTWAIGCFAFASLVLSYGCPPLRFLGPFILFFSSGLITGYLLLSTVKKRYQHAYAQFCGGMAILVLHFTLMYMDNVTNSYNYYSPQVLERWPFTYLGSPWQGLLTGISFACLFDVFYSLYKPQGQTFDFSINTVGWIILLFFAIGLAVLLPNYNLLTYGGDSSLSVGPAPEINADIFSDMTVFIYHVAIPLLLVGFFLLFSLSYWRSRRGLDQKSVHEEGTNVGGEAR